MSKLFAKTILPLAVLCLGIHLSQAQTIKIWPNEGVGSGVSYGGDVKLTLFEITRDGNTNSVNQKLKNQLKMDMVRVPFVAHWGVSDGKYDEIRDYINNAKGKNLKVFLSIANTTGEFRNAANGNYILKGAEREGKFPSWLKGSNGVHGVNINRYKNYIEDVIDELGSNKIDYIGPWNEDNAKEGDYPNLSKPIVGYEAFKLTDATSRYGATSGAYDGIKNKVAVAGSHDYNGSYTAAFSQWKDFASKGNKPEWFTETTKYDNSTAEGIAHMLPAISAGLSRMIIYQAVPRLVNANGTNGTHYAATKRLIDNSKGKGSARRIEFSGNNKQGLTAAFKSGSTLHIHLSNVASGQKTYYINLQGGPKITGVSQQKYGGNVTTELKNQGKQIKVTIAGKTYVHLTCSGLTSNRMAQPLQIDPDFVEFATRLFPNPASEGIFTLLLPDYDGYDGEMTYELIDIQGKKVDQRKMPYTHLMKVNYSHLPKGIYTANIRFGDVCVARKVVIGE